jgi:hypothetical protein
MTTQATAVSVTRPFGHAIDRVKLMLFQPFDLGKWFVIGFCAWLAQLGEQGFTGNFNFGGGGDGGNVRHEFEEAREFVMSNLYWIIPAAIALVTICIALWLVFTWLNSRGRFMFLHCVALDRAEVVVPWHKYASQGNSLFLFRILLGLIGAVVCLPLVAVIIMSILRMAQRGEPSVAGILMCVGIVLVMVAVAIVLTLIEKLTKDFVVPIMFLRGVGWRKGWREFWGLLSGNVGHFILYILFQIVLALAIGAIVLVVVLATCCIAGCLLALPYLGTVLFLPVLVFSRAYSLHYFAQFGREYDVFAAPASPGAQVA